MIWFASLLFLLKGCRSFERFFFFGCSMASNETHHLQRSISISSYQKVPFQLNRIIFSFLSPSNQTILLTFLFQITSLLDWSFRFVFVDCELPFVFHNDQSLNSYIKGIDSTLRGKQAWPKFMRIKGSTCRTSKDKRHNDSTPQIWDHSNNHKSNFFFISHLHFIYQLESFFFQQSRH